MTTVLDIARGMALLPLALVLALFLGVREMVSKRGRQTV
ncbi:hypothetical protein J2X24_001550 [Asticcacaulis solisilvae]|jgi:hypothetical protein|nr:hypothetical protein [Asticcacaulis solisilvae]MDR6800032.1 hypothetical protein [Asticcacaulis sp. BE141]